MYPLYTLTIVYTGVKELCDLSGLSDDMDESDLNQSINVLRQLSLISYVLF